MFGFNKAKKEVPGDVFKPMLEFHKAAGLSIAITEALKELIEKYGLPEEEVRKLFITRFQKELEEYAGAEKGEFNP